MNEIELEKLLKKEPVGSTDFDLVMELNEASLELGNAHIAIREAARNDGDRLLSPSEIDEIRRLVAQQVAVSNRMKEVTSRH